MSYHPRAPPPRRSASSALAQALRSASRPRSTPSLYSNTSSSGYNPYSAYSTPPSSPSYLSSGYHNPSTSSYSSSPSSSSGYHNPSTSSYSSSPSSSSGYHNPSTSSYSSSPSTSSYNKYKSTPSTSSYLTPSTYKSSYVRSRVSPSRFSGVGSRSGSTTSLSALSTKSDQSEGYVSEGKSRLGSTSSLASSQPEENGEIDYKKLYEAEHNTNERLRETLRKTEDDLEQARNSKGSTSEAEKRERRAMERKLSEMEEELKLLEALKQENQRLRDENGALIRVISKLSK